MSQIKLVHSGGNGVIISAPSSNPASDVNLKLPQADGSAGQLLKTDGSGNLSFATVGVTDGNALSQFSDVVQTSEYDTSNTSFQDTGFGKSIIPSASSSRVLVIAHLSVGGWGDEDRRYETALYRGSVSDSNMIAKTLGGNYKTGNSSSYSYDSQTYVYIDTPATTSSTVYRIGLRSVDGTTVRLFGGSGNTSRFGTMFVQEIKG